MSLLRGLKCPPAATYRGIVTTGGDTMTTTTTTDIMELRANGFNIVTGYKDKKRPNITWKRWQTEFVPEKEFRDMLLTGAHIDTAGKYHKGTGGTGLYCMITGQVSNVIVVDVDSEEVYNSFFKQYEDKTVVVSTPTGGKHLWFRVSTPCRNTTAYNGFPIDVRGDGGQVVVPPSKTDVGTYTFVNKNDLKPMLIERVDEVLAKVPSQPETDLSEALKRFYRAVNVAGHDLKSILMGFSVADVEGGAHGVYKCECMFHKSENPHKAMELYNTNTFYCHGCGETGDMIDIVRHYKECDFRTAVEYLENLSGVQSNLTYINVAGKSEVLSNEEFYVYKTLPSGELKYTGLDVTAIAEYLTERFHIKQVEAGQTYFYDDEKGIYRPGNASLGMITTEAQTMFGNKATVSSKHAIVQAVRDIKESQIASLVDDDIFRHEGEICFKNGVYHEDTGRLVEHSPDNPHNAQLRVKYDPNAKCPRIDKFMTDTFVDVEDEYEWIGYCMSEGNWLRKFTIYVGETTTGKTTYTRMVSELFAGDSVANASPQNLTSGNESPKYIATLHRAKINVSGDISARRIHNVDVMKVVTGEDVLTGRPMRGDPVTFVNRCKSLFSCNRLPSFGWEDGAIAKRLRVVHCDHVPKEIILGLLGMLTTDEELSGLVNHALAGLRRLRERGGFKYTCDINMYEKEAGQVTTFTEDELAITRHPGDWIYIDELYARYLGWCEEHKFKATAKVPFIKEFVHMHKKRGVSKRKKAVNGVRAPAVFGVQFSDCEFGVI
jgi:putative DNA primase/helicase